MRRNCAYCSRGLKYGRPPSWNPQKDCDRLFRCDGGPNPCQNYSCDFCGQYMSSSRDSPYKGAPVWVCIRCQAGNRPSRDMPSGWGPMATAGIKAVRRTPLTGVS